ncbi:hypothetical protein NOL04_07885 [Streptococcus suis]|uniref:Uncharacterized protein n=1 Tax=Streptococcus iners subsp. hyiners TaxID=3028083 RepID=A0AA97AC02_9STRE|nr:MULTISPECIES: hypothetical protein [Streptococcus]MCK4030063.1 hypothetical protein [Streptococcus suis]MCO8220935.1 hypothetical protein [Streptococcus suis]MDG4514786.1 hypothetical protein [Streptococcus suis]WNY48771.1 hypothetical protein PW220_08610 [Streptococcus sp. 29892]HEM3182474.1 hypothetical protein [Streptococcus suis 89-5259]
MKTTSLHDLPPKWRNVIIGLRIAAVLLPLLLVLYFWLTLGALIQVMVG